MWFDQDVLNSYLNGMYNELPTQLNYTDIYSPISEVREEAIFYHFWGKKKPWTVKGFLFYKESFYQIMHRKLLMTIITLFIGIKDSIKHFLIFLITLKIFNLKISIEIY